MAIVFRRIAGRIIPIRTKGPASVQEGLKNMDRLRKFVKNKPTAFEKVDEFQLKDAFDRMRRLKRIVVRPPPLPVKG